MIILLCTILVLPSALAFESNITSLRTQPDSTSTRTIYHTAEITNLTTYFTYTDGLLNLLQGWHGGIYRNGAQNTTIPYPLAHYSFDYDYNSTEVVVKDRGTNATTRDGTISGGMFDDGIVLYMPFDAHNSTHFYDYSNIRYAGLRSDGITEVQGRQGIAMEFTGNDQAVNITVGDDIKNNTAFSIAFWMNASSDGENDFGKPIQLVRTVGTQYWAVTTRNQSGDQLQVQLYVDGADPASYITDYAITVGEWHHVVWTFDNSTAPWTLNAYVDGSPVTSWYTNEGTGPMTAITDPGIIMIGNSPENQRQYDGMLDEIYLYNKSLTSDEVLELYSRTCHRGQCYDFDGDNSNITIPQVSLNTSHGFAISAWIYDDGEEVTTRPIVSGEDDSYDGLRAAQVGLGYGYILSIDGTHCYTDDATAVYSLWANIIVSVDDGVCTIYVNGLNKTDGTHSTVSGMLDIYSIGASRYNVFEGRIDDVVIWNSSLTPGEAMNWYKQVVSTTNLQNGTYHSQIMFNNGSGVYEQVETTTYLYDTRLGIKAVYPGGATVNDFKANLSNLNNSDTYDGETTDGIVYFNASMGIYNVTVPAQGIHGEAWELFNVVNPYQNLTITVPVQYNFTFIDEDTLGPFNMSSFDEMTLVVTCPDDVAQYDIGPGNASYNASISCELVRIKFVLTYGTDQYYRTLLLEDDNFVNVYLLNLLNSTAVYNTFVLFDMLGLYENASIKLTRSIGGVEEQILGDYVDIENKITAYLLFSAEYNVRIGSTSQPERTLGTFIADAAGTKYVNLFDIDLGGTEDGTTGVSYSMNMVNMSGDLMIIAQYNDSRNQTTSHTFTVREDDADGAVLFTSTSSAYQSEFVYDIGDGNLTTTYYTTLEYEHPSRDDSFSKYLQATPQIDVPSTFQNPWTLRWIIMLVITIVALGLSIMSAHVGAILIAGFAALMHFFGWWNMPWVVIGLVILTAVLSIVRRGETT